MTSDTQTDAKGWCMLSGCPRPVDNTCQSQRDTSQRKRRKSGNMMYDRRVRRNALSQYIVPTRVLTDPAEAQRRQVVRRRALARKRKQSRLRALGVSLGRKHVDVQTDLYLEELADVIAWTDAECQTDAFVDRPASPLFIACKSGKDVGTQILEGELFDFDREVQPMLEVLVGKTVEQSLREVMEDHELDCLRAQQRAFQEMRYAELAEVQRLQEQERRCREEKEHRIVQQRKEVTQQRETEEKMAAHAFARQYLTDLLPSVFTSLRRNGFFYDPVERDIESNFFPWLMTEVHDRLEERSVARQLQDNLIYEVVHENLQLAGDQESKKTQSDM